MIIDDDASRRHHRRRGSVDSQKPADTDEEMMMAEGERRSAGGVAIGAVGRDVRIVQDGLSPSEQTARRRIPISGLAADASAQDRTAAAARWGEDSALLGLGYEYADIRVLPITPSSYLRPGSRFHGTQQSERQRYDVQVEIKHVDLRESFLCGYLRIQG
jgi:hypothetical protein